DGIRDRNVTGVQTCALPICGTPATLAAKKATSTIPIVMAISGDALATGLVDGLAKPGGNITGLTFFAPEVEAKQLELLHEALPRSEERRVGKECRARGSAQQ